MTTREKRINYKILLLEASKNCGSNEDKIKIVKGKEPFHRELSTDEDWFFHEDFSQSWRGMLRIRLGAG